MEVVETLLPPCLSKTWHGTGPGLRFFSPGERLDKVDVVAVRIHMWRDGRWEKNGDIIHHRLRQFFLHIFSPLLNDYYLNCLQHCSF